MSNPLETQLVAKVQEKERLLEDLKKQTASLIAGIFQMDSEAGIEEATNKDFETLQRGIVKLQSFRNEIKEVNRSISTLSN